jgi:phosphoketolase
VPLRSGLKAESNQPLSSEELHKMHEYWRVASYLSGGQIFKNALLREPIRTLQKKIRPCA